MIESKAKTYDNTLGTGSRIFAAVMGSIWIAAGLFGVYRALTTDPLSLALLGALALIYGTLWLAAAVKGKWGRTPLWP